MFSSIELFNASNLGNPSLNKGIVIFAIVNKPIPKTGITIKKITAIFPPIKYAIVNEKIKFSGALIAVRISIINAICTF